ncbi:LLM class flavin-dependent oxidoreductase [Variovorax atrisoli]|uniref:LLM class flavin-dependent oxidoreductase n=1 Tax=Variovorax atrisoli TaxID=3394203 RepID=UPI003AAFAE51
MGFVDTVSDGRLELGIGSGYQQFEFERFGVKIEDSGAIYNEFLDILPKGLTQKIVAYDGEHLKLPPSSIAVRCLQDPMPPLWITSGNPVTLGRGVREGHNLFVTALLKGDDAIGELRQRLDKVAGDNGKDLDRDVKFGFLRCAYASDSKAEIDAYLDCALPASHLREPEVPSFAVGRRLHDQGGALGDGPDDGAAAAEPAGGLGQRGSSTRCWRRSASCVRSTSRCRRSWATSIRRRCSGRSSFGARGSSRRSRRNWAATPKPRALPA